MMFPRTGPIDFKGVGDEIIEAASNTVEEVNNAYKDLEEIYGLYLLYDSEGMEAVMNEITVESDNPEEAAELQGVTKKYKNLLLSMVGYLNEPNRHESFFLNVGPKGYTPNAYLNQLETFVDDIAYRIGGTSDRPGRSHSDVKKAISKTMAYRNMGYVHNINTEAAEQRGTLDILHAYLYKDSPHRSSLKRATRFNNQPYYPNSF